MNTFPTEIVTLPSKGMLYDPESALAKGEIEMKYMTAKEEDILTNQNFIEKGIVLDKLMRSLIVTEINYDDLLIGDKNGLMIAARILSYGKDYTFEYNGEQFTADLSEFDEKPIHKEVEKGVNNFEFTLPNSKVPITFKLLSHKDEKKIDEEVRSMKRLKSNQSFLSTTRMKHTITSIDGSSDQKTIREFVDKELLAMDARALRKHIEKITPDMDLFFFPEGTDTPVNLPITVQFFYPDFQGRV